MIIDCDSCQVRGPACGDCMVTAMIGHPGDGPVKIDGSQQVALSALAASGMVPPLRLVAALAVRRREVG